MPEPATLETEELLEILRTKLGLRKNAGVEEEQVSIDSRLPYTVDFVVKDEEEIYFVEAKNRANVDEIAQFVLLKELLKKEGKESSDFVPVIAAKIIPPREEELAKELGIKLIQLPRSLPGTSISTRFRISPAALLVKVTAKIFHSLTP